MGKRTRKSNRKKTFVVYGRIESPTGRHIEHWTGNARSMATAMRRAITDMWKLPNVRWKHLQSVTLTAYPEGGDKAA